MEQRSLELKTCMALILLTRTLLRYNDQDTKFIDTNEI
jgi:hypothetical protein